MVKSKKSKAICLLLCGVMLVGCFASCQGNGIQAATARTDALASIQISAESTLAATSTQAPETNTLNETEPAAMEKEVDEVTRTNYVKIAEELANKYREAPEDTAAALAYTGKLIQLGELGEAKDVLAPMLIAENPDPQTIYLSAQVEYLNGRYKQAESLYETLLNNYPDCKDKAEYGLEYIYYQTNRYQEAQALTGNNFSQFGLRALMKAFGDKEPYKVSWAGEEKTVIPFVVTDPLPVVQVEVNGEIKKFIIDTGASETYLNETDAKALGVQTMDTFTGVYAGGAEVETTYGILDSMKLNGVTLTSVPVNIVNIDHLSSMYDFKICGIFGTGVFRQFKMTMDYLSERLVLKSRGGDVQNEADGVEMPFIMADMHFMMCQAMINGKKTNLFLDSGLAAPESLLLPKGTLEYTGIPIPELGSPKGEGKIGETNFEPGKFTADTFELGRLPLARDVQGLYGVFPEFYYYNESIGTFVDGIISHNYLKQYKWTIDFDTMTMTFSK